MVFAPKKEKKNQIRKEIVFGNEDILVDLYSPPFQRNLAKVKPEVKGAQIILTLFAISIQWYRGFGF